MFDHRRELGEFLNRLGLVGEAAEVGVHRAAFSVPWLESWHGRCLHLVDSWEGERQEHYLAALERLRPFGGRWETHRLRSVPCATIFDDGSLDCVYIDADHSRESVAADLRAWWPKLKSGGLFCGHDYHVPDGWIKTVGGGFQCGVAGAVQEFAGELGLEVRATKDLRWDAQGNCREAPSWWVVKP